MHITKKKKERSQELIDANDNIYNRQAFESIMGKYNHGSTNKSPLLFIKNCAFIEKNDTLCYIQSIVHG